MIEEDTTITEDTKLAATFNALFSNGNNDKPNKPENETENVVDINHIIAKFKNHPRVIKIKENTNYGNQFSFALSRLDEMKKCVDNLNTTKPTTYNKNSS